LSFENGCPPLGGLSFSRPFFVVRRCHWSKLLARSRGKTLCQFSIWQSFSVIVVYCSVTVVLPGRQKVVDNQSQDFEAPTQVNVTVMPKRPREYLTESEIERLMDAARQNRWGHRDPTAILLAYRHGLRASELVALRWDDVDFTTGRFHVPARERRRNGRPPARRQAAAGVAPPSARITEKPLLVRQRAWRTPQCGRISTDGRAGWKGS
jgi:site-specific recombinase XerC